MQIAYPWFNTRIGSQTISPRYYFTDAGALVESARGLLEMGSDVIKLNLHPGAYLNLRASPAFHTLRDYAELQPDFRTVFDMPFRYFILWAQPHLPGMRSSLQFDEKEALDLYQQIFDLAAYFLRTYNGTGKTFLIGQWEADWVLLGSFDPLGEVTEERAQGMVQYLTIRQRAVEDARRATPHSHVWVGHFAEANRPLDAKDRGLRRMANAVLPHVAVDMVSYSAYDALWPNRVTEALDYLEGQARCTDYFDGIFEKKVFIGEYDAYRDYHQRGYFSPARQVDNTLTVITSGLAWGAPFILFWEYYNNEQERLIHGGGFWLVDDQGVRQPVYYLHRDMLAKIHALKNLYRFWFTRNPREQELNGWADLLYRKRLSEITELLLNAGAYAAEVDAETFAQKAAGAVFGGGLPGGSEAGARACRAAVEGGQPRFQALLDLLDDARLAEAVPAEDYLRALRLEKRVLDRRLSRSALWLQALDSAVFLEEELALRFAPDQGASMLQARYFPFYSSNEITREGDPQ